MKGLVGIVVGVCAVAQGLWAADFVLPQNRNAFYSRETVELAVAGLGKGERATLELTADKSGVTPVSIPVVGDGSTMTVALPGNSLAPAAYKVKLDGKEAAKLTLTAGVNESPMFVSQTGKPKDAGANFRVGNFFGSGLVDPKDGQPLVSVRGKHSQGMSIFERAIEEDQPTVVYMYWTGYVTHKPFGDLKSWAAEDMTEAMRLLNFRTAQSLRRFDANIISVGTLDEPGLSWGQTPAGGMASGFPNRDEKAWYTARGWEYTNDPGARSDSDWMKYMAIRCSILKEQNAQACKDLKSVWPSMVFATDLYAPHAIMDGTEPMNQEVNDIPTSHVFMDWGCGKLGALSGLYLEKCDDPTRKLAHAMNGQLMNDVVPQPGQSDSYRTMINAMLMAGLEGNWWLNEVGMTAADLKAINEPVSRMGPLFAGAEVKGHDIAVLWSFTECAMRQKDLAAREAKKKTGEQIKLMIASLPEGATKDGKLEVSAYSIGQNYKDNILQTHQAISRAGYPAHILHEARVAQGWLKNYKVLVIIGQTFDLPADVRAAITAFQKGGGIVVVDKATSVKFDGALVTEANVKDLGFRWGAYFAKAKDDTTLTKKQKTLYTSNFFMDEPARAAAPLLKATLAKTPARPAIVTDSVHLAAERHQAGEGALIMVLNATEQLPAIADDKSYWMYNYAPCQATYTLKGLPKGASVYVVEGADWSRSSQVAKPAAPIRGDFAAGEMKLYLVAPNAPKGLALKAVVKDGALAVSATLKGLKMVWPFTLTVTAPDGTVRYSRFRGTDKAGSYSETLPLGVNSPAGDYRVRIESPVGGLKDEATVKVVAASPKVTAVAETVRVFDEPVIRSFLAEKPSLVVAYGSESQKTIATKLAADLKAKGLKAVAKAEGEVLHKAKYPRVWNPTANLCKATGDEKAPAGAVKHRIRLGVDAQGVMTCQTEDGKDAQTWRTPESVVTIIGDGFVDYDNTTTETCYEPGVKLYVDAKQAITVLKGKMEVVDTTPEFRARWMRPWHRLTSYQGVNQYPPQLPEAYTADSHLVLLGDSTSGTAVAALQASEILAQTVDASYPGPGKALVQFAWSPFGVGKNVIHLGASDEAGLKAAAESLLKRL